MWRKGEIIPILKVDKNPADIASFRPITLTCVMCKLTECLIVRRLNYYLEKFHCVSDRQAGFRLYRNTTEQVARLTQERTQEATYLGIVLDLRLSWNKQASRVQAVGKTRNGLLKRLSGVKWGTTQDLLCTTYKSYIRPAIESGSELLVTASEAVQNKIETVQNNALRIITGGAFLTPIQAMQLQANIKPLPFRRKMGALKLIERLKRHGDFWRNYNPAERRLKSQPTFLHVTLLILTSLLLTDSPCSRLENLFDI
ncbi:putative RNA-directed DNA polymerase from transposon BS [Trichonephila clavata]|uniref:Putative RNA-directed DNA polymerase from transposon BS n=1 Tax=Trichonephila clavata TaxID=2740835 RepID=A0A8X6G2K1_TRICU|nr:putative RNA-directed DNA polymerase from transposon BS [Trichonephila clavata]